MYSKSYFVTDGRYFSLELCYSRDTTEPTLYNESNLQNQVSLNGSSMWEWSLLFHFKSAAH